MVCHLAATSTVSAQCNQLYEWTTWTSFSGNSADGTINYGGSPVGVNMTANYTFGSTPGIYNFGAFSGFGGTIPNTTVPYTTWAAGPGGVTTMCFSQTVTNPVLLIASLGNGGNHVTLEFSLPYALVYDGGGMTFVNATTLIGAEGYAIIEFPGDFDCVTIYSSTPEWYTNITWGLHPPLFQVDIAGDPEACNEVNLTANGGNTYSWSGGEYPNQPTNTFTTSGNYFLTVTDNNGCTVLTSVAVEVFEDAQVSIFEQICEGTPFYFQGNPVSTSGTYTANLQTSHGCDSTITLELEVFPSYLNAWQHSICEGESYQFHGQSLTQPGQYKYTDVTQSGCDSIDQLQLIVLPRSNSSQSTHLCAGETLRFGEVLITQAGTYTQTLANYLGCDSTVTLVVSYLPQPFTKIDSSICQGDTLRFNQQMLTSPGVYLQRFNSFQGCDSLVQLQLSVNPAPITRFSANICQGESYLFEGEKVTASGQYVRRFSSSGGCDSLVVLNLSILPVPRSTFSESICQGESRTFGGKVLRTTGVYRDTLTAVSGCDSITILNLTVQNTYNSTLEVSICEGQSYLFYNQSLTKAGQYTERFTTLAGCDSLILLSLRVLPSTSSNIQAEICPGRSYSFGGNDLWQKGTYQQLFSAASGCDSMVILSLNVLPYLYSFPEIQICQGESIDFNGRTIEKPGIYLDTIRMATGCDSIVELRLNVFELSSSFLSASMCDGQGYPFAGDILKTEGEFTKILTSQAGCDSVVSLALKVFPTYRQETDVYLCPGESVLLGGQILSQSGFWNFGLKTSEGCDSMVAVRLTVHPEYESVQKVESETPFTWPVNGATYDQSGIYTAAFLSAEGCDSIHILDLRIIPVKKWFAPNILTGTGSNGRFTISGSDQLELVKTVRIFDRWGNLVSELSNLPPGNPAYGWDGRSHGGEVVTGVYVFIAELAWKDRSTEWISGDLTLMR